MKVDVVIPTYNSATVLDDCLNAIVHYIPYNKIIIVDGESTDKTIEIAKKYNCKIYRYKGSLGESRMLGISKVDTKWLLFIDSDIVVDKYFFNNIIKYIGKDVGAIQGYALQPEKYKNFKKYEYMKFKSRNLGLNERGFTNCTLIRTELIKDVDLKGIEAYEDWLIKNHILEKGYKWLFVPVPVKHFHDYKGSLDANLKVRWNGAGLRKSNVGNFKYLLKWFLGTTIKKPIVQDVSLKDYINNIIYFLNTLIGYLFYKKYTKIKR